MKKSELVFNLVSIPTDIAALTAAGVVAFYLRYRVTDFVGPVLYQLSLRQFALVLLQVIPVVLLVFAIFGLYNLRGTRRFIHEFNRIVGGVAIGLLLVMVLFFFNQQVFPSRFVILAAAVLGTLFIVCGRAVLHQVQEYLFSRGYGLHRLAVINGAGTEAEVLNDVFTDRSYGYRIVAQLDQAEVSSEKLDELYRTLGIDEIVQTNPTASSEQNLRLVEFARNRGLQFSFVPNLFEVQRNIVEVEGFRGVPVISLKNTPLDGWGRVVKRVFDVVVSALALILLSPVYLAIAIAVKLDSSGPAVYAAPRGGRGRDFIFYKFRTMHTHLSVGLGGEEAEEMQKQLWQQSVRGDFFKVKHDPRVTRVGRILRRTKLDELPQFWNVLRGDISMVGPRPHLLDELERYREQHRRMFSIKPGVFGVEQLAQLTWPELPLDEAIRLNTYYIENWSVWWDIKILLKTGYVMVFAPKPSDDY